MGTTGIATLVGIGLLLVWAVGVYNRLVRRRNEIHNAYAQIDVQLKRRHDLVPNLVATAAKYLQHERETLQAVTAARLASVRAADVAREQPGDPARMAALGQAQQALGGHLGRLLAVVEAYPELKADATLHELREELTHTENRIAFARQAYNDAVLDYNNSVQQAPGNLVAALTRQQPAAPLQSTTQAAEREPVAVRL
jgi:LemA protein